MARVLIVAYGNPLRSDDGVAWRAAAELAQPDLPEDVEVTTRHQLTPELAFQVSQVDRVLFVDAARTGTAGDISAGPVKPELRPSLFTHEFSPGVILGVAQELYGASPEAFVISVGGECFDIGEGLSPNVEASLPGVVALVRELAARN